MPGGGYTLSWNGTAAALTAEDLELTATPGALYVEVNGRALYVEHGVQVRDGRIALPLEVLAEAAGLQLTWDEVEGAAWLSTDQAQPASASYPAEDLYWLSRIISAESRGEPLLGQIAVGNVILNRVESSQYPDTVEGVVFDTKYGVQFQPVEGTGQTQLFDLLGEVGKEGAEVYGGQTDGYDGQHGGQQPGTLPLADLAQADGGTHQQNGGEHRRTLPALVVAQQVKRCKIVKAFFIHLNGNANILGHKVTLLFGHSTTFTGKKQAKDASAAVHPACKPPARRGKIRYYLGCI